jgi:TatA/E family protein of Tat protein translocase
MPQIGPLEILVVSVIALIVFGPQRLPEIARSIGRALNEFKRQASDIRSEFESGLDVDDEPEHPGPIVHKGTTASEPDTTPIAKLPDPAKTDAGTVPSLDPDPDAAPSDAEDPPQGSSTTS